MVQRQEIPRIAILFLLLVSFHCSFATTVITLPTGNFTEGCDAYITLGDIVITEDATDDFSASQTDLTYVLNFDGAGFEFNTSAGSVSSAAGNRDIDAISIQSTTASTLTIQISTDGLADKIDEFTITGLQIKVTTATAAGSPYAIYYDASSTGTWGMTDPPLVSHATLNVALVVNISSNAVTDSWPNTTAWSGGVVPGDCDNVTIVNTAIISLNAGETACGDLTIDNGGTLSSGNNRHITVHGNYSNSGTQSFGNSDLTLDGVGKNFTSDGTNQGTITLGGQINFTTNHTIPAAADITTDAIIDVAAGVTVTNNGTISMTGTPAAADLQGAGTWINAASSILNIASGITVTTLTATATGNTVDFNGTAAQTMAAFNYYNLTSSSTGARTLAASGTVGVAGTFTPGTNAYTITGSTIDFNGSGAQTILAFNYNNLTSSSTGARTLASSSTVGVAGTFTQGTNSYTITGSTVEFNGSAAQTIATSFTFNNLTINNSNATPPQVTVSAAININGTLDVNDGQLSTGGLVTLVSNVSGTAAIADLSDGTPEPTAITGNVITQRYIGGTYGWKQLAGGVSGAGTTLTDWYNEFHMDGFTGTPGVGAPSVQTYNEATAGPQDQGWTGATNTTNTIDIGVGYICWVQSVTGKPFPATADLTGAPTMGTQAISVTYTDDVGQPDSEDGWNFIGNPYACDIRWDLVTISGTVTAFAYVWDETIDNYVTLDQASPPARIASQQGFFVKTSGGGGTVTFDEADKEKAATDPFKKQVPDSVLDNYFEVAVSGSGASDITKIRFLTDATENYDLKHDAHKLYGKVNISTMTVDSVKLSINSLSELTTDVIIPLQVNVEPNISVTTSSGTAYISQDTFNISLNTINEMALSSCIVLEDLLTGTLVDMRSTSIYSFTIPDTALSQYDLIPAKSDEPRFLLHIGAPIQKESLDVSCYNDSDGVAIAEGNGNGPWNYTWLDANNNILKMTAGLVSVDSLFGLSAGTYTVKVSDSASMCGTLSDTLIIDEPKPITVIATITDASCYGFDDGTVNAEASGGTLPYAYSWSNGFFGEQLLDVTAGYYEVTVTDNNGCEIISPYTVGEPNEVIAIFFPLSDTISLANGGFAVFTNESSGSNVFEWDFGDGTSTSSVQNPTHNYSDTGNYTIQLIASNGICSDTASYTITVLQNPLAVEELYDLREKVRMVQNDESIVLYFDLDEHGDVNISIFNALGQKAIPDIQSTDKQKRVVLYLLDNPAGIYFVTVNYKGATTTLKAALY